MANKSKLTKILYLINLIPLVGFDVYSLLSFLSLGIDYKYGVFVTILVALDIIYLLIALGSNTRLKYSLKYSILYFILSTIITGVIIFLYRFRSDSIIMTTNSFIYFSLRVGISFIVAIPVNLLLRHDFKYIKKTLVIIALVISTVLFVANITQVISNGFYGQGTSSRPLIYSDQGSEYEIVGIVEGSSKTLSVPTEFDFRPVNKVSTAIFSDEALEEVNIPKRDSKFEFTDLGGHGFNENIRIVCDKGEIDDYREVVFREVNSAASTEHHSDLIHMVNAFIPGGLSDGEFYVTYELDDDVIDFFDREMLKVWIGSRDDAFRLPESDTSNSVIEHMDSSVEDNLKWAFERKGYILKGITDKDDKDILGSPVEKSMDHVKINLEKIYKLLFNPDNDSKYELDHEYTRSNINGSLDDYKYVLDSNIDGLIPERIGFNLTFKVNGTNYSSLREMVTSLALDTYTIDPIWEMKAPRIDFYKTSASGNTITYGDSITLSWDAYVASNEFSLESSLYLNDTLVLGNNDITKTVDGLDYKYEVSLTNVYPNQAGVYRIVIHNKNDEHSSLTSEKEEELTVIVNPIQLSLSWDNLESTYDGLVKDIKLASYDEGKIINNDIVSLNYKSDKQVKDAGSYTITVSIDAATATKYKVSNTESAYTVNKREITITGTTSVFTYDGLSHSITVNALDNVVSGEESLILNSLTSASEVNANKYNKQVTTSNNNYTITNPNQELTINKRDLTITVSATNKTYDGTKGVFSYKVDNKASTDQEADIFSLSFSNYDSVVDVGTYTISPTPENKTKSSNYNITVVPAVFEITKRNLTITVENVTKTYDGKKASFTHKEEGIASTDSLSEIAQISFSSYDNTVNAGTYQIEAKLTLGTKAKNYNIINNPGTLTINKASLTIKADEKEKTYDGAAMSLTVTPVGLISSDSLAEVCTVVFGDAKDKKDAGSYEITFTLTPNAKYGNYEITTENAMLKINKRALTIKVNDVVKDYDKRTPLLEKPVATGLAPTDKEEEVYTYKYEGTITTETKVGTFEIAPTITYGVKASNYEITVVNGTLTINKAVLTITASDVTKVYDGKASTFTYTTSGLVGSDDINNIVSVTVGDALVAVVDAGSYDILLNVTILDDSNYEIKEVSGKFTITPCEITLVWGASIFDYDGEEKELVATDITGMDAFDAQVKDNILASISYTGNGEAEVGTHNVSAQLANSNFVITNSTNTYEIKAVENGD